MKLLYVENHGVFGRIAIHRFLSTHEVTLVATVREALTALALESFDAVLVDYDLDDEKGSDLVRAMRRDGSRARVIAVSATPEGNAALVAAGADAVCGKMEFSKIASVLMDQLHV